MSKKRSPPAKSPTLRKSTDEALPPRIEQSPVALVSPPSDFSLDRVSTLVRDVQKDAVRVLELRELGGYEGEWLTASGVDAFRVSFGALGTEFERLGFSAESFKATRRIAAEAINQVPVALRHSLETLFRSAYRITDSILGQYAMYGPGMQTPTDKACQAFVKAAAHFLEDVSGSQGKIEAAPIALPSPGKVEHGTDDKATHSDDFRSVNWFGMTYHFTPNQAACIRVLWEEWRRGGLSLALDVITRRADIHGGRVATLFRRHPAWGTMIISPKKGSYCLNPPVRSPTQMRGK